MDMTNFLYKLWDPTARKLIKSRDIAFLKNWIVGDKENSDESQSSPKIPIISTSVSSLVVHDDHGTTGEDNNDSLVESV